MPEGGPTSRRRLAVDVGSVRVGVARSDPSTGIAVPVSTVARDRAGDRDVTEISVLARELGAEEIVVGLPVQLDGTEGLAARSVREWTAKLGKQCADLEIRLVDERLTTAYAHKMLGSVGRDERGRRSIIDQAAAVAILDTVLEAERQGSKVPGTVLAVSSRRARKPRARQKDSDA